VAQRYLIISVSIWLSVIVTGLWRVAIYENKPGVASYLVEVWPRGSTLSRDDSMPTLIMTAHPRCACTRASIHELARIVGANPGRVHAAVLFILPPGKAAGWEKSDIWRDAASIPGVTVHSDYGGRESARFGAQTSGQCFLFAPDGRRLFAGGITPTRGHEGDSPGKVSVVSMITRGNHNASTATTSPVFGCALYSSSSLGLPPSPSL
jgi:hypothetical protein